VGAITSGVAAMTPLGLPDVCGGPGAPTLLLSELAEMRIPNWGEISVFVELFRLFSALIPGQRTYSSPCVAIH
jgi:hypothetical protein